MNQEPTMSPSATLSDRIQPLTSKALAEAFQATVSNELPPLPEMADVDHHIDAVLDRRHPRFAGMVEQVRHFRGKRFRPLLVILTARALGSPSSRHAVLGASMELIHTATLVHDDVLDGAQMRRHSPTVNARYDNYNSILLGDWLFSQAFALASSLENLTINKMLAESACKVCEGELQQGLERGNLDLDEAAYFRIIDGKTAELLAACCKSSAVLAGAPSNLALQLESFGRKVGMAFQVADDILDLIGDEERTGKSLGTDLSQGKLTLPMIHALKQPLGAKVRALLQNPPQDITFARRSLVSLLNETGSIEYSKEVARELISDARTALFHLPASPWRQHLALLAEKAIGRSA